MRADRRYLVYGVDQYRAGVPGDDDEYFIAQFDDRDEALAFAQARAEEPQAAFPSEMCDRVVLRDTVEDAILFSARRPAL